MSLPISKSFKCSTCGTQRQGWKLNDGRLVCPACSPPILVNECQEQIEAAAQRQQMKVWTEKTAAGIGVTGLWLLGWVWEIVKGSCLGLGYLIVLVWKILGGILAFILAIFGAIADGDGESGGDRWKNETPTLKQLAFLVSLDAPIHAGMTRGEASETLDDYADELGDPEGKKRYHELLDEFEERARDGESVEDIMEDYY
ncbi:MAG: hypothetical protein KIS92_16180 [Planctomycetota bacterium]|nr:hypothetical protein [Planctomycetota bacterium]